VVTGQGFDSHEDSPHVKKTEGAKRPKRNRGDSSAGSVSCSGALAGPGPAIPRALAADGCHVIVADADLKQLLELVASLNANVSDSVDCCPIPELDKPYRNSKLETFGRGGDLLIDNREWADYVTHSMLRNITFASSAACDDAEPSIHLLSVSDADTERVRPSGTSLAAAG